MTKDNVDVVVVHNKQNYSQTIFTPILLYQTFTPKNFQLNKHYNINNIIIFGGNNVI